VNPGPINSFLASATTPQPASTSFRLYMEALDQYLNRKTDYSGLMSFFDTHTGGTAAYQPKQLAPASWSTGLATLTPGVSFTKAETVKVAVQGDNRTGQSNDIVIHGATATSLLLAVSTNQPEAGVPFGLTLTSLDTFGNVAINYGGTVGFSCTDIASGAKVPATYTFVPADQGIRSWLASTTLMTPGPVTITVKDTVIASMTKSYPVTVLPGPAARFEISCSPIVTAGVPFNIVITAYDAYGNKKTNFTETVNLVTTFTSILPSSVSGFSNGELLVPSTEVTHSGALPATGLIRVTFGAGASGSIPITLYPPSSSFSRFDLEAIPASPTAGDAFKLVIKAVGPDGAVYTNYAGVGVTLDASNTSGLEVMPPMLPESATGFTIGVKEVYARIWEAGTITIWAHDQTIPGKVGSLTLTVLPTNLSYYTIVPGTSTVEPYPNPYYQVVNGSFPLYLSAFDSIGNLKTNYTGTVSITENGTGTLTATQATFVGGQATISATIYDQPGKMQITIHDTILDKLGTSSKISFFGPIASLAISCGTTQTDEAAFLTQVNAYDIYGQLKLNTLASLSSSAPYWSLAPGVSMNLTPPSLNPVSWVDGVAYPILTANRGDAGADVGTLTFGLRATSTASVQ
ncbi:MAG TPA: hypothetical protein PKO06_18625, partial [Candidatus Ozemobacteraceae bacterium]|nr:hypothetical protein [Candidatus Ozemobacteraceae bacterium]